MLTSSFISLVHSILMSDVLELVIVIQVREIKNAKFGREVKFPALNGKRQEYYSKKQIFIFNMHTQSRPFLGVSFLDPLIDT